MTLAQQFPDVSMLIREQKKLDLNYNEAKLFEDIHYNPITPEQKRANQEAKGKQFRILIYLGALFATLFFIATKGQAILNWMSSQ